MSDVKMINIKKISEEHIASFFSGLKKWKVLYQKIYIRIWQSPTVIGQEYSQQSQIVIGLAY
jgi:hypothetical protein